MITQEQLKNVLKYNPNTGVFVRTKRRGPKAAGTVAGCPATAGYIQIVIGGKNYSAHRLAWLYTYGLFPDGGLDHINGRRDDNRIANLRRATRKENAQNVAAHKDNKAGLLGVCYHKPSKKWYSQICVQGEKHHLGYFTSPQSAHVAYLAAKARHHKFQPTLRQTRD